MAQEKKKRRVPPFVYFIGMAIVVIAIAVKIFPGLLSSRVTIIDTETLKEKVAISELSTAKFAYNGIATYMEGDKEICKILYHAYVNVGADFSKIEFNKDDDNKTVNPVLPDIRITSTVVDETSLSFIPSSSTVKLSDAIKVCKEDVQKKAADCDELWISGKDRLQNYAEGLIYPYVQKYGYRIIWE